LCIDYIYAASVDLKRGEKTEEKKGDGGKTRRKKKGLSFILKSLH